MERPATAIKPDRMVEADGTTEVVPFPGVRVAAVHEISMAGFTNG
jgi:hypothetical protein